MSTTEGDVSQQPITQQPLPGQRLSTTLRPATIKRRMFGLSVDALSLTQAVEHCLHHVKTRERMLVGVLNASKVVHLRSDAVLRESLLECDILLADGQSVVWASRFLRQPLPERVTGIDLFESLLDAADKDSLGVYLLGAKPEVMTTLTEVVAKQWPGLRIAGARDGYFKESEWASVAADIKASGADMLFLGISSPTKENFLAKYGDTLGVPVLHGVGGSFDIFAGVTRRAPRLWQKLGMEWAYRVLQEPGRLFWRYATTNPTFVALTFKERIRHSRLYSNSR